MIRDTILVNGVEKVVHQILCAHRGEKILHRDGEPFLAKEMGCTKDGIPCGPVIFTPVYECVLFRRCVPFTSKLYDDQNLAHPCMGCLSHVRARPSPD